MARIHKFIGFDIGAESGRCVIGMLENERLSLTEAHRFHTPFIFYHNHYYWDVLAIFQELQNGLARAVEQFGSELDGISVDTWGVDYVLLDADDRLLGYPYHYRDSRTDRILEKAFQIVPKEKIYKQTGIQFLQFNTLFQLFAERFQKQSLINLADKMLLMPDFLLFLLSGVKIGEYTIVSTSNLADPFKRDWAWDLVDAFKLPRKIFPLVIEPGTVLGELLPEIAGKAGLSGEIPVIASASHDTGAAVAAIPAEKGEWAFLSSGTWSLMGIELHEPLISDQALRFNFTNEGGVGKTIRFLKNITGLWPIQECRRVWAAEGKEYDYGELAKMAQQNGPAHAWIDVDDARFLRADEMPQKIVAFLKDTGQSHKEDVGWISRCVLESLAFKYRAIISELEKVTGKKLQRLHAVGGGIQNEVLNQLTADAIGMEVIAGPVEGTIAGNIGLQAIATGAIADLPHLRKIVANSFELKTYHPKDSGYFQENWERYLDVVRQNH